MKEIKPFQQCQNLSSKNKKLQKIFRKIGKNSKINNINKTKPKKDQKKNNKLIFNNKLFKSNYNKSNSIVSFSF